MSRCLEETGPDSEIDTRTNVWLGKTDVAEGEVECAVAQTVHFTASFALEWWCATNATAEDSVSRRQRSATRFENGRIKITAYKNLH